MKFRLFFLPPRTTSQQKRMQIVGGKPMFFKSEKSAEAEADYYSQLQRYAPAAPLLGPISMECTVIYPYLKSDLNTKAKASRTDYVWHTGKPDLDNFIKQLTDVLVRLRFVPDDAQIVEMRLRKCRGPKPGLLIALNPAVMHDSYHAELDWFNGQEGEYHYEFFGRCL